MHPGDDPALAARFLGWLQARHAEGSRLGRSVARLSELAAWDLATESVAALPLDPAERARLLELHALWREFVRDVPADWVELARGADDVTWVDPAADLARPAPPGRAPELVRASDPGPLRPRRRPRPVGGILIVSAAALALGLPLLHSVRAARRQAAEIADVRAHLAGPPPWLDAARSRLIAQVAVARRLLDVRASQRAAVNATCEGEPECVARLEEIDRSVRLARSVLDAALADPLLPAGGAAPPAGVEPAVLLRERETLAGIAASAGTPAARARSARAELDALSARLGLTPPP